MKTIAIIALLGLFSVPVFADGHHGRRGPRGPEGPQGPQGEAGLNGLNGINGADGEGVDTETKVMLSGDVRIWDLKHASMYFFDNYNWFDRHNDSFGVRVSFKLGKSYEEKEIEKLKALINMMTMQMVKADGR